MTTIVDQAVDALRKLPADRQVEVAEIVLAATAPAHVLTAAELAAVDDGLADAEAGRFASDEEVASVFDRLRTV